MKIFQRGLMALAILLLSAAIGTSAQSETAEPEDDISLIDTQWLLVATETEDGLTPVAQGSEITLDFEGEDQVTGNGGCNQYNGSYTVEDETISFGALVSTRMACSEDALTAQEQTYVAALEASTGYVVTENQLTLMSADEQVLHFIRAEVDVLLDTAWHLTSFGDPDDPTLVSEAVNTTLEFRADHQVGGSGGCNSYGSSYTLEGTRITFTGALSTMRACRDRDSMRQESAFFAALDSTGQFALVGDQLVIWYENGQRLTFEKPVETL